MAFVFDLQADPDPPATDNWGMGYVEFAIGYDLDTDVVVLMSVMLEPVEEFNAYDLRFGIRERQTQHNWNVTAPDYTKETVDRYIPKDWRVLVGLHLSRAVTALVGNIKPENITMETYYSGLEQKALKKYDLVSTAVHVCGYQTADQFRDETTLKDHWLFTKRV